MGERILNIRSRGLERSMDEVPVARAARDFRTVPMMLMKKHRNLGCAWRDVLDADRSGVAAPRSSTRS